MLCKKWLHVYLLVEICHLYQQIKLLMQHNKKIMTFTFTFEDTGGLLMPRLLWFFVVTLFRLEQQLNLQCQQFTRLKYQYISLALTVARQTLWCYSNRHLLAWGCCFTIFQQKPAKMEELFSILLWFARGGLEKWPIVYGRIIWRTCCTPYRAVWIAVESVSSSNVPTLVCTYPQTRMITFLRVSAKTEKL